MLKISSQGGGVKIGWETNMENGAAIIQNLVENCSSGNVRIGYAGQSGSDTITRTRNIMQWHNTYVGESFIDRYNSIADTNNWFDCTDSLCKYVGNFFGEYATKQDVFGDPGENGWRTNRWTALFGVGSIGNACGGLTSGGSFNPEYGIQGGFSGLSHRMTSLTNQNNAIAIAFDFVSDLSFRYPAVGGTNSVGGGDYHMGANSIASGIVPVLVLPYDLEGAVRTTNSNPGAYVQEP